METKKCSQCKTDIAKDAKKCPQCHADIRSWFRRHYILTSLGILIILSIALSSVGNDKKIENKTPEQNTTSESVSNKTYQQIFTFSGNGIKKSEPFTISGDRFKIAYDCKGDSGATLCTAFVFKVGSTLPQGVMNSPQAVKDETIIYTSMAGKGEYYIDANTMGNFTMTVYDYK